MQEDSALAQKASLAPQDLVGIPLISCLSDPAQERLQAWFGPYAGQLDVLARGSLMYNEALLAQSNIGAVIVHRPSLRPLFPAAAKPHRADLEKGTGVLHRHLGLSGVRQGIPFGHFSR